MGLSPKEQRLADEAWYRFQTQARPAPYPPPPAVLANDPHPQPEVYEDRGVIPVGVPCDPVTADIATSRYYAAHPEDLPAGSMAEAAVIALMDETRGEEIAANKSAKLGPLGKAELVSQRIRGGKLVGIFHVGRDRWAEAEL